MCVCVCERERESVVCEVEGGVSERERDKISTVYTIHLTFCLQFSII